MVDLHQFLRATNPTKTLDYQKAEDRAYYIDFTSVRGEKIIQKLRNRIVHYYPDNPTCDLFTGHIGCGKSTELLRLRNDLEQDGFFVVYFESTQYLEMTDVDTVDVLLVISQRISEDLEAQKIQLQPTGFRKLLHDTSRILNADVTSFKLKPPKIAGVEFGELGYSQKGDEFRLSTLLGEITANMKSDSMLRKQMNQYLGPKKFELIKAINQELLDPASIQLKQNGKKGLVVIVDNLDRIDNTIKEFGKSQQEYLFIDQGDYLKGLNCHILYTIPLALLFSNSSGALTQRFENPKVLPMVSVKHREGKVCQQGIELLRQMVLVRAYPKLLETERLEKVTEIFESLEALDELCVLSGGHVRDLLRLLSSWIEEEGDFPLTMKTLAAVKRSERNNMTRAVSEEEYQLLKEVIKTKKVSDEEGYQKLIYSRFVFEYQDEEGTWYDVNPILRNVVEQQTLK